MKNTFESEVYIIPFDQVVYITKDFCTPGKTTVKTEAGKVASNFIEVMFNNDYSVAIENSEDGLDADRFLKEWEEWQDYKGRVIQTQTEPYCFIETEQESEGKNKIIVPPKHFVCEYPGCNKKVPASKVHTFTLETKSGAPYKIYYFCSSEHMETWVKENDDSILSGKQDIGKCGICGAAVSYCRHCWGYHRQLMQQQVR